MKAHQPIAAALSLLTLSSTISAQESTPAAATEVSPTHPAPLIEAQYYYELSIGSTIHVDFCVPMVSADQVGKPVEAGYFRTSIPDCMQGIWVSPSRLQLAITGELPLLQMLQLEIPAGLKGLKGEILAGRKASFPTYKGTILSADTCDNGDVFIVANPAKHADELRKRLPQLCYRVDGKTTPLNVRPATVADILAHCDDFYYYYADREALSKRPPEEEVPNVWLAKFPGYSPEGKDGEMLLPQADWDYSYSIYSDYVFRTVSVPSQAYELHTTCNKRGSYRVKLQLDMPTSTDMSSLISSLQWSISHNEENAERIPLEWKDGALRGQLDGQDIVLTPTDSQTSKLQLTTGEVREGLQSITFAAETGGLEPRLHCEGGYPTLITTDACEKTPGDATTLRPARPYIYTDVTASHLQLRGSTTLRCRYGRLQSGNIRVWKLDNNPAQAVRLLQDYRLRYKQGSYMYENDYARRNEEERKAAGLADDKLPDNKVATDTLPGVVARAERPLQTGDENELSLPLAELFPGQPVGGLYFVEAEGEPLRHSKTPAINQGLVQVTDLGLMWKTNGRHLFARAYSLSTAQDIPAGTLKLYDKAGKQLTEMPVKNGLAQGDFPAGVSYLQLSTTDDCVTLPHDARNIEQWQNNSWNNSRLMEAGICPADVPTPIFYSFSDRELYRPGETAHIKGMVRWLLHNKLSTPEIESATAKVQLDYKTVATLPVTIGEDGTFSLDVPMQAVGQHSISFDFTFKGDADNSSPDTAFVAANPGAADYIHIRRSHGENIQCKEFRRNEFEVQSTLSVQPDTNRVQLTATATNFTTTPVAHGRANWLLSIATGNFYPQQPEWREFRFGDFRTRPWDYFYAYSHPDRLEQDTSTASAIGALDAQGKGSHSFSLPDMEFPRLRHLTATSTITNGNEQSIRSVQKSILHPADVYAGIRTQATLAKVGGTLPVELVAVKPDGTAWDGTPLTATVELRRTVFHPYRYGTESSFSVRNSKETTTAHKAEVQLTGTPAKLELPVESAGQYDVLVSGTDARGRKFCSATRHYVWGDEVSPWEYLDHEELELVADKPSYRAGDTAHVLVQTPVDAELLVTVEREGVLRHYRRSVSVDKPVIDIPVEAGDAPVVYVNVSLVQSDARRGSDGKPVTKLGTCELHVEAPEKELTIQLTTPQQSLLPGEPCTVSGTITDATGKPVPHADVTLYAEDEGTLQVMGYKLPDPLGHFYSPQQRRNFVNTYSGLGHLVGENLKNRYLGNKGVFIGGGDDYESEADISDSSAEAIRRNFTPCALWLASIKTDAQGRFTATYSNPDTMTRYRLMAVAGAGDKFGAGESSYQVNKPIMLEPIAPMSATEGDEILLPVTVSMLPGQLPAGSGDSLRWQVSLSGQNVDIPQPSQSVTLCGNSPATLHFPIRVQKAAPTQLQWRVQAADAAPGSPLAPVRDAVELSFDAVPPSPHLREYVWAKLTNGQSGRLNNWLRNAYRAGSPVQLTMSTSPLAGLGYPLQYLFTYPYGCTEQLCSTVIPWLLREELQETLGLSFPEDKRPSHIIAEVKHKLLARKLDSGRFSYWDGGHETSEFSPYAVFILNIMGEHSWSDFNALKQQITDGSGNCYLSLLVLSISNKLGTSELNAVLQREGKNLHKLSANQKWILAICAAQLNHRRAAELHKLAQQANESTRSSHTLPPLQALRTLYAIGSAPKAPATEKLLRDYLQHSAGQYSTWRNAWMLLCVHFYNRGAGIADRRAKVNGTTITTSTPMQVRTTTGSSESWLSIGNPVYVTGFAEGYLAQQQAEQAVSNGFDVSRRYEQLQPDGSWQPTATFRVGDIVRVSVTATAAPDADNLRYLVLEDRLPAAFEAVDPQLISQALPEGVNAETLRSWYSFPASVNNREFLKDRVRVFADNLWNTRNFEVSYVARVVRSGKVTAPAAKAELMYRPEVHGLSIPQRFEVKPR